MSTLSKYLLGLAVVATAAFVFAVPARANHAGFQHSTNCVKPNVALDFSESDIGLIIDLVFDECGMTPTTEILHGNYRRVSNQPNPSGLISAGNARRDAVVYDSDFRNQPGNAPCKGGGGITGAIQVKPACIEAQIGVNFDPAITLTANVTIANNVVTIADTTDDDANATTPFLPGQLVDAGSAVGGFDCVVLIKNGTPKLADIICDMNMWFDDGAGNITYGLKGYDFGQPVNRAIVMWMMGPNPTGSMTVTNDFCDAINANGDIPARNFGPGADLSLTEDPASYALGTAALREETSISASADYIRVYGEPRAPFNLLSCFGTVAYCDTTEPTPDPTLGEVSGNACNRNVGSAAPPEIRVNQTLPGNGGTNNRQGGGDSYFDVTNPFGP